MTSVTEVFRSSDKLGEVPVWDVAERALESLRWAESASQGAQQLIESLDTARGD